MATQNSLSTGGMNIAIARPVMPIPSIPTRPARNRQAREQGAFLLGTFKPLPPGKLPPEFLLPVKDLALSPLLNPGDEVALRLGGTPAQGDVVLIGTIFGPELRQYEPLASGGWAGRALHPDYEDVCTSDEQCWIEAVMFGVVRAVPRDSSKGVCDA